MTDSGCSPWELTMSDGIVLRGDARGPRDAPVIVATHGYPDNRDVWEPMGASLADRFRFVRYDIRGMGTSGAPSERAGYGIDRLAADLDAVITHVSPDRPAHLLGHDWGSVLTWHAVTGSGPASRAASFTSISGPCLDHVQAWFVERLRARDFRTALAQSLKSAYIPWFLLPALPEALWRSGLGARLIDRLERADGADPAHRPVRRLRDFVNGLELYRANMSLRGVAPQGRSTSVPVQVLAPTADPYISTEVQHASAPWVPNLVVTTMQGGHWVPLQRPGEVAQRLIDHIDRVTQREEPGRDRSLHDDGG